MNICQISIWLMNHGAFGDHISNSSRFGKFCKKSVGAELGEADVEVADEAGDLLAAFVEAAPP
ncbi:hypothetical protein C3Y05_004550 [Aeromonas allosaccharophila]|uniref:hypothetical protein n=1 Tax=Aeromonas allosaccharophila TaxID=656 RepID=UPI001F0808CA|nr:hypothetical protein [Aeromonas allosaccharophila]WDO04166.1 hypothetical protein C3Y05_004550 [Aeromonas allosaccharophila]